MKDPDHLVYYNGIVINDRGRNIPAVIDDARGQSLIEKPDDWDLSVIRFDVDTTLLPFSKVEMLPGPAIGVSFRSLMQVNFRQVGGGDNFGYVHAENNKGEYGDLSMFIRYWNFGMEQSFSTLPPATQVRLKSAPQFYVVNGKLRLIFPEVWLTVGSALDYTPKILFNAKWAKYLLGFPLLRDPNYGYAVNGGDARIRIDDETCTVKVSDRTGLPVAFGAATYGVGGDLAYIEQQFTMPGTFAAVRAITLTTTSLPVVSESIPNTTNSSSGVSNASASIISDYLMSTDTYTDQHRIEYLPQAEFRMTQLNSTEPIRRISIQAWWADHFGNRYPILLSSGGTFSIKLIFKKRTD
jgi:hypothetical protein